MIELNAELKSKNKTLAYPLECVRCLVTVLIICAPFAFVGKLERVLESSHYGGQVVGQISLHGFTQYGRYCNGPEVIELACTTSSRFGTGLIFVNFHNFGTVCVSRRS